MDRKIVFYLGHPTLMHQYEPVLRLLPRDLVALAARRRDGEYRFAFEVGERLGLACYVAEGLIGASSREFILLTHHAKAFQEIGPGYRLEQIARHHALVPYSYGVLDDTLFAPGNKELYGAYEVIFCNGPYQADTLRPHTPAKLIQIGYPRYDRLFTDPPDRDSLMTRFGCDPSKRTIVWLPTLPSNGQWCSVPKFAAAMSRLASIYNIILKLHPDDRSSGELARSCGFTMVITDPTDNIELFAVADFCVCDYYGSAFGALYADLNLLLFNTGDPVPNLADGVLRSFIPNLDAASPIEIERILGDRELWREQKLRRQAVRQVMYAPYYGTSSEVMASAIKGLPRLMGL